MSDKDEYKNEYDELDSDYGDAEVPLTAGLDLGYVWLNDIILWLILGVFRKGHFA